MLKRMPGTPVRASAEDVLADEAVRIMHGKNAVHVLPTLIGCLACLGGVVYCAYHRGGVYGYSGYGGNPSGQPFALVISTGFELFGMEGNRQDDVDALEEARSLQVGGHGASHYFTHIFPAMVF